MVVDNFVKQAQRNPNMSALKTRDNSITYQQLMEKVYEMASYINDMGLDRNEPIGLAFPNSIEFVALMFACELNGHPSVLFGAALKSSELCYHVQNLGLRMVLACSRLTSEMEMTGARKILSMEQNIDCWRFEGQSVTGEFVNGDFICQLTSGTNGIPKAVIRTEEAVWREIFDIAKTFELSEKDIVLTIPPIHHSYGLIGGTLTPLCFGATTILLDGFMPAEVINVIETEHTSILFAVPFMYHILNKSMQMRVADFSSLRLCLSAGAPMSRDIASEFLKYSGKFICQDYGSTEAGTICLNLNTNEYEKAVGLPLGDHDIKIVGEHSIQLPVGETGEIWIKSGATARCYLYPKSLNDIAFNGKWFNTGDLGYVDKDGYIYIIGRKSSMINVAGLKVDPAEVEKVISKIPGVEEVAVVGIDSETSGQVIKAVIAVSIDIGEINVVQFCKKHLSDYKIPRIIQFVKDLPKTTTGKVLRKHLIFGEEDKNAC